MGTDIHVMGLQAEVRGKMTKKYILKIPENFPNLMKQITHKEAHPTSSRINLEDLFPDT